jgi:hypothetical protein
MLTFILKGVAMRRFVNYVVMVSCVALLLPHISGAENKSRGNPPVITATFAAEKGYFGYVWKIYIEADDPDGDMARIASVVHQRGYGSYPPDWIIVKAPYQKHLKGYIQWNTYSSKSSYLREWTDITLRLTIIDKAGNESSEVVFPFEFVSGARREPKPAAPFNEENLPRLGYVHIDLLEPTQMAGEGPRTD